MNRVKEGWLAQVGKATVTPVMLANAANFFRQMNSKNHLHCSKVRTLHRFNPQYSVNDGAIEIVVGLKAYSHFTE